MNREVWSTGVVCVVSWLDSEVWMVFVMWQNAVVVCWLYVYMSLFYVSDRIWLGGTL
jgi:hypothetical protein